jgi:drug/metabolite transporter (DMT)-like permease
MTSQPSTANWISIFALGLIWGGTFMVVSIALRGYGPITVACARTTLGALALLGIMFALRRPLPSPQAMRSIAIIGPLNTALPFMLLSWGLQYVPSAFAGISMAVLPLFVLPLAYFFSDETLNLRRVVGVMFGVIGAIVLIGPGVLRIGTGMEPWGQIACLLATLSYSISSILTRRCPPVDSITMAAFTLMFGSIIMIPLMIMIEGVPTPTTRESTLAIIVLGLVPTAFAAYLRILVVRTAGSVFMTNVNYQVPLWSVVFGAVVLDENLPIEFFIALGIILAGLAISQGKNPIRLLINRA